MRFAKLLACLLLSLFCSSAFAQGEGAYGIIMSGFFLACVVTLVLLGVITYKLTNYLSKAEPKFGNEFICRSCKKSFSLNVDGKCPWCGLVNVKISKTE